MKHWAREALGYLLGTALVFAPVLTWSAYAEVRGLWMAPVDPSNPAPTPTPDPTPTPLPDSPDIFYVRADGDGSDPKTTAGAWDEADFNNAANWDTDVADDGKIGPGDTVYILDDDGDLSGLTPQGSGLGTATGRITIRGEEGGSPVVDGAGTSTNALLISGVGFLTVRDITFEGGSGGTSGVILITGAGSDSNIIRGNDIGNSTQSGILLAATAGASNEIRGNTVHDNEDHGIAAEDHAGSTSTETSTLVTGNTVQDNGQDGIRVNANFWVVENNVVLDNGGAGAYMGINVLSDAVDAGTGDNNIIRYNSVTNQTGNGNDGTGISVGRWADDAQVYYNLSFANDGPGFSVNDSDGAILYNNVAYGNCQGAALTEKAEIRFVSTASDLTTVTAMNNVGDATAASTYAIYIDSETSDNTLDIDTNDWRAVATNWYFFNATGGNVLATWNAIAAGVGTDLNDDPQFVTPGTNFDLQSDSTLIDAGQDVGLALDFDGQQIIQPPDIGAYEGPPEIGALVFQGGGANAKGHLGTVNVPPFTTCTVTNLNGSGAGSLRTCVTEARTGPRLVRFSVGGEIVISTPIEIKTPYLTIDGFTAPSPGITLRNTQRANPPAGRSIGIIMTHDIIIRGIRFVGPWPGPGSPGNPNHETVQLDGDGNNDCSTWDDEPECPTCEVGVCNKCGPGSDDPGTRCTGNRDIILDHNTFTNSQDDMGSFWCDTDNVTSQYNFYYGNYHPTTRGCLGWKAESDMQSRRHISDIGNFYSTNGERTPKYREGTYRFDAINNIIHAWQDYGNLAGKGPQGVGMWFENAPNYRHNIMGNVFLPDVSIGHTGTWRASWDCVMAADPNATVEECIWGLGWFEDNLFTNAHNPNQCRTRPTTATECPGQAAVTGPFNRDYPLPEHIDATDPANIAALEALIDTAGMPYPTAAEQVYMARAKLKLNQRLGLEP